MTRPSFEDVLHTNYVPTTQERCNIMTLVQMMEEEVSSLDQTILPLLAKRDSLKDTILAHKALLAPARRLLPELVTEVFTHSARSIQSDYLCDVGLKDGRRFLHQSTFPRPSVSETPLKLGRVCRHWRWIALSTSSLWSAITIPKGWSTEGLREWISRAASCNLSFSVTVHRHNVDLLKLLVSHQQRWKVVVLRFHDSDIEFTREFVGLLSPSYSNLQTLDLGCLSAGRSQAWPAVRIAIGTAPNLTTLQFLAPLFRIVTLDLSPSLFLRQIFIECYSIAFAELLSLLRLSPVVESVRAKLSFDVSLNIIPRPDVLILKALKDIKICGFYAVHQNVCPLDNLCLPALEDLSFHIQVSATLLRQHPAGGYPKYTPNLRSFLRRSRPPLKVLRLEGHALAIGISELTDSMQFLTDLSCFDVAQVDGGCDGIVELLTGPIPPPDNNLLECICPQLKEINLDQEQYESYVDPDSVINMILSRSIDGRCRLTRVAIRSYWSQTVSPDPRISDCIANGLVFKGE